MKNNLLLVLLLLLTKLALSQPPCSSNPPAGETCETATPICELNGYCGNTTTYSPDAWGQEGAPLGCGFLGLSACPGEGLLDVFCGSIENDAYLQFVASETSISLDIWITSSSEGDGIQVMIFETDFCGSDNVSSFFCDQISPNGGAATSITASGLVVGNTYYMLIDGFAGDLCEYVIGADEGIQIPISITPETATICNGETIDLTASGGDGIYTWDFSADLNTTTGANVTATPTAPGVYTYTANSATGNPLCPTSTTATATITVDNCGCSITANYSGDVCAGGSFDLSATNVTGATSYSWVGTNGYTSNTQNPTGITAPSTAGTYTYTVTANSPTGTCSADIQLIVYDTPVLTLSTTAAYCGNSDGTIIVSSTNSTAPIDYVWFATLGGSTTNGNVTGETNPYTITSLSASTYQISVTDANGCSATSSIEVENTGSVTADFTISADQCLNGNSFDFTDNSGLTSGITYELISPSFNTSTLNGTPDYTGFVASETGTWTVTQHIATGTCTDQTTLTFEVYEEPSITASHSNVSCNGFSDGEIIANSSVTGTYSMTSANGSFSGSTASNLSAGTYTFEITTANGCTDSETITIYEPDPLVISTTATGISCYNVCDGEANVNIVSGGTGPFTYSWGSQGTGTNLSGLCTGTYTVTVYDNNSPANACFQSSSVFVEDAIEETYSSSSINSNCGQSDGSATINVTTTPISSHYSYVWYDSSSNQINQTLNTTSSTNTQNSLASGIYYVEITNANGCTDIRTINISDDDAPIISIIDSENILCHGENTGSISVSLTGNLEPNFTYQWNRNNTNYTTVSSSSITSNLQNNLFAGNYEIIVTDNNGCQASISTSLTEPTELIGNITPTEAICINPGSATANISGGTTPYNYIWDDNATQTNNTAINLTQGNYNCTINDNNGCELILNTTVTNNSIFESQLQVDNNASCFGASDGQISAIPISGNAPYLYEWNNDLGNITSISTHSNLTANSYEVTITDVNGCISINSINVTEPDILSASALVQDISCYGMNNGSISIEPNGGTYPYTYLWSNNTNGTTNINLSGNYYNVQIIDANGCLETINGIEVIEPNPVILGLEYEPSICIGQTAEIRMSATSSPFSPYHYYWNGIETSDIITVSPPETTTYTAKVIDSHGCESELKSVTIIVNPPISLIAIPDKEKICKGDVVNVGMHAVGGNGNYNYRLIDGTILSEPITLSPLHDNEYKIIVSDDCGSPEDTISIFISVENPELPSFHANIKSGCTPLDIKFTQDISNYDAETEYLWNFGDINSSSISFEDSPSHTYNYAESFDVSLQITSAFGCVSKVTKHNYITAFPVPTANFVSKPSIASVIKPIIYFKNNSTDADFFYWSFGDGDSTSLKNPEHKYATIPSDYHVTLTVMNNFSCTDSITNRISIKEEIVLYIPDAFTPDYDGKNEIFITKGTGIIEDNFTMTIYDRWGEKIFSSDSITKGWDGKIKGGSYGKPGIYTYLIQYTDIYHIPHEKVGSINLIR